MALKQLSCALLLVAGCSAQRTADGDALRAALTPARVAALDVPMLLVEAPGIGVAATLVPLGQNGGVVSWRTRDGVQLSLEGGVIVATRGLGDDVMSADVALLLNALRRGGGHYDRRISRLDGNFGLTFETWRCVLRMDGQGQHAAPLGAVKVMRFDETCDMPDQSIENQYSVDQDQTIWFSRQWVGPDVGYLETSVVRP